MSRNVSFVPIAEMETEVEAAAVSSRIGLELRSVRSIEKDVVIDGCRDWETSHRRGAGLECRAELRRQCRLNWDSMASGSGRNKGRVAGDGNDCPARAAGTWCRNKSNNQIARQKESFFVELLQTQLGEMWWWPVMLPSLCDGRGQKLMPSELTDSSIAVELAVGVVYCRNPTR